MVEKTRNLSPEQIKTTRLSLETNELEIRKLKQQVKAYEKDLEKDMENTKLKVELHKLEKQIEVWKEDLENDIPNKKLRLEIRKLNDKIDQIEYENKIHQKRIRTKTQVVEEVTEEDIKKFEEEKAKEAK